MVRRRTWKATIQSQKRYAPAFSAEPSGNPNFRSLSLTKYVCIVVKSPSCWTFIIRSSSILDVAANNVFALITMGVASLSTLPIVSGIVNPSSKILVTETRLETSVAVDAFPIGSWRRHMRQDSRKGICTLHPQESRHLHSTNRSDHVHKVQNIQHRFVLLADLHNTYWWYQSFACQGRVHSRIRRWFHFSFRICPFGF